MIIPRPSQRPRQEFYYRFEGVGVAWQVWFLILARDPARYRPRMLPSPLEKASLGTAVSVLHLQHRAFAALVPFALLDLMLGAMFLVAFWKTR